MCPLVRSSFVLVLLWVPSAAQANCACVCVDGEVQALCTSTLDIEPICPPRICSIVPPSIEPIQPPRVPPIGTSECSQRQVYNEFTKQYDWQEVCY